MIILRESTAGATRETNYGRSQKAAIKAAQAARREFPDGQSTLSVIRVNKVLGTYTFLLTV